MGSQEIRFAGTPSAQQTPPLQDPPGSSYGQQDPLDDSTPVREQPLPGQQSSANWFQQFTPATDSDEKQNVEEKMDMSPQASNNTSTRQEHGAPGGPPTMEDIQAMIREAVEEAHVSGTLTELSSKTNKKPKRSGRNYNRARNH